MRQCSSICRRAGTEMEPNAHRDRLLTVSLLLRQCNSIECGRPCAPSSCWDVGGTNKKKAGTLAGFSRCLVGDTGIEPVTSTV